MKWEMQLTEFPVNKPLTLTDRQYLSQVYENTDTASDDFLLGCIKAAAEKNGIGFEQAVDVFDQVVAWYDYVSIDNDELAQAIGGDILRLLRDSEQEFKESAVSEILTNFGWVAGSFFLVLAVIFGIGLLLWEAETFSSLSREQAMRFLH